MPSFIYKYAYEDMESLEYLREQVVQEVLKTKNYPPSESFLTVDDTLQSKPPDEKPEFLSMQIGYIKSKGYEWFKNTIRGWYFPDLNAVGVTTINGERSDPLLAQDISKEMLNKIEMSYPGADIFSLIGGPHLVTGTPSPALELFMNYLFKNANKWSKSLLKEAAHDRWWVVPGAGLAGAALATLINLGIPNEIIQEQSREGMTPHQIVQEYVPEELSFNNIVEETASMENDISIPQENLPRGIRNNNPGNIESNEKWQGMSEDQGDERFITFETPEYGIRAMARILRSYQRKYNLKTVQQMISRWAPASENDTESYVNHISQQIGVSPDAEINLSDDNILEQIIDAMIRHENGDESWYNTETIQKGIKMERMGSSEKKYHYAYQNMGRLEAEKFLVQLMFQYGRSWDIIVRKLVDAGLDSDMIRWLNERFSHRLASGAVWNYKY